MSKNALLTNNTLKANVIRGMEEKLKERGFKKLDDIVVRYGKR